MGFLLVLTSVTLNDLERPVMTADARYAVAELLV